MQYILMINEDESAYQGENAQELMEATVGKHVELIERMQSAGVYVGGERLQPAETATTIKWDSGGHTLHDGPFSETHEELGGYYVIETADLDSALEWAKQIPIAEKGAVEVRPIWQD